MNPEYLQSLYWGTFTRTPEEEEVERLAHEYHTRCEEYDRIVCTGRDERGIAVPVSWQERVLISRNALVVDTELRFKAAQLGASTAEWRAAVRHAASPRD